MSAAGHSRTRANARSTASAIATEVHGAHTIETRREGGGWAARVYVDLENVHGDPTRHMVGQVWTLGSELAALNTLVLELASQRGSTVRDAIHARIGGVK